MISGGSFSQEHATDDTKTLMRRDFSVGLHFNTNGWGFGSDYGWQKNYKYKHLVGFVLTNIRHPKEYKIFGALSNSKGYYFGKLHSLVSFRPYYGGKVVMFKGIRENGIEISAKWSFGGSIALVKPVYLRIDKFNLPPQDEKYNPVIHNSNNITSRSSWFKGLDEASMRLGGFAKVGIDFNFSGARNGISGGEVGIMFDYFPGKEIVLMYDNDNFNLHSALYLQFNLGQKLY